MNKQFCARKSFLAKSEEGSSYIFLLGLYTITVLECIVILLLILSLPFVMSFFFFISPFFIPSQPCTCRSGCWLWCLSHQHLPEVFVGSCKVECCCSSIISTLMQSESKLQSIQCGGNNFLFRYFSAFLYLIPIWCLSLWVWSSSALFLMKGRILDFYSI